MFVVFVLELCISQHLYIFIYALLDIKCIYYLLCIKYALNNIYYPFTIRSSVNGDSDSDGDSDEDEDEEVRL